MAFRRGDDSDEAFVGAMLVADGLASLRALRTFVTGVAKASGGGR